MKSFDDFVREEINKIILALSTIPDSFPDELKLHIQKLLLEEKQEGRRG